VLPMSGMDEILENIAINAWARAFSRAPGQANAPHESDAELIALPGSPDHYLAITIDTVAEEIRTGLYRDPYTMGWVTVMASLSDLAAVGADPLGLVVSASTPPGSGPAFVERASRGMEEASRSLGVFILGGDSNASPEISFTGCAVGVVPRSAALTRRGLAPGDAVFLTGAAGAGNALGLVRLAGLPDDVFPEASYRPQARLSAGQALRGRATACMDTSDGVLTTLDQLARLNGRGFEVDCDWPTILAGPVLALCEHTRTPAWMMLAGPHGEFELVFTVPAPRVGAFATDAAGLGLRPIRIGTVQERPAITLKLPSGRRVDIDMAPLRNLLETAGGDLGHYLAEFKELGSRWGLA
jgi:thiamine-monophosphate kinase